jgi:hypothetical protein
MRARAAVLIVVTAAVFLSASPPASAVPPPDTPNCPVFPADNVWRADVSRLPIHPRSDDWIRSMGGAGTRLHPDFGPSDGPVPYGIPYDVVDSAHDRVGIDFAYADESDPGPYPFGPDITIEGGSDRHAIMIDRDTCTLYELFDANWNDGAPTAGSGAVWALGSNALRPGGWTSADAAGLSILAGLVRLDEVQAGVVDHAIRVTASRTDRRYVWPARHQAGAADNRALPPMGARFRLKPGFAISGFRPDTQVILRAMKRYGLVVADNGSNWYFQGTAEDGWNTEMLDELKTVPAGAFHAVDATVLKIAADSGQAKAVPSLSVWVRPRDRSLATGGTATIEGDLDPPHAGQRIYLERRSDGRWRAVAVRRLSAGGGFSFSIHPTSTGRKVLRVRKPADHDHIAVKRRVVITVV